MTPFEHYRQELRKIVPLTDGDCDFFDECLTERVVARDGLFVEAGQRCDEIGFLHQGLCRMYYLQDGKEINTHFFLEGSFVTAYQSFLQRTPSRYYIQALEDSTMVTFTANVLQEAYAASHRWERVGRLIAEQTYLVATARMESFLFYSGEERYLQLVAEQPHLLERIPLYHLASYLGMERESLSRLRKKISGRF